MKKLIVVAFAASLAACGGSKSTPRGPILGTPLTVTGQTQFGQYRSSVNAAQGLFPGMANTWDLDQDFSLNDGAHDQVDGALSIYVGTPATSPATYNSILNEYVSLADFPYDQALSELTWMGPVATSADGLVGAAIGDAAYFTARNDWYSGPSTPLGNAYSALLLPGVDSRLSQAINLSTAGTNILLGWSDYSNFNGSPMTGIFEEKFQVVLRTPAGALLTDPPLYVTTVGANGTRSVDLSAFRGQQVVLSFEVRADAYSYDWSGATLDDVSVSDGTHQFVQNGNFETGTLAGWTATAGDQPRGLRSGERTLDGLTVTRSFYAPPTSLWGRWADVYENKGTNSITTSVVYVTNLGSDNGGVIYATPGSGGKAISTWDAHDYVAHDWDRDLGIVFGNGSVYFVSASGAVPLTVSNGLDDLFTTFPLTVAPGQRATIVQFIVLGGFQTMSTATSDTAKATEVDTEAARIATSFWTDVTLRDGLTQAQIDSVRNF